MVKTIHRKKHNKTYRKSKKMVGGAFTQEEINELGLLGFNAQQIHTLEQLQNDIPIIINLVRQSTHQVNPTTQNLFTPQEIMDTLNEIPQDPEEIHNFLDNSFGSFDENDDSMGTTRESLSDISFDNSFDSLHLSDLDISNPNNSVNTTKESVGGKKTKKSNKKSNKKSKNKKSKKTRKIRSKYNKKGGQCYGNGVGANSYDPNFSIYNTRELQLFPYKPTN